MDTAGRQHGRRCEGASVRSRGPEEWPTGLSLPARLKVEIEYWIEVRGR